MLLYYKDIVLVDFAKSWESKKERENSEKYEIELHQIRERFGDHGSREFRTKPLCVGVITKVINGSKYRDPNRTVGKEMHFDYSYIKEVVKRSGLKLFPKLNIHKKKHENFKHFIVKRDNRLLCGPLKDLCKYYLGQLNEEIQVDIDYQKLKQRANSLTGVVDNYNNYTVKKKNFNRWFKRNWRFILRSKRLENQLAMEENRRMNDDYADDYFKTYEEKETKKLFSEQFKQQYDEPFLDQNF